MTDTTTLQSGQRLPPWAEFAPLQPILEAANIVGLYEWDLVADRVTPCLGMARMFGLSPATVVAGAPSGAFLAAIHRDDRERYRKRAESDAEVVQTSYRIRQAGAPSRPVLDVARYSRDARGVRHWACGALFDQIEAGETRPPAIDVSSILETLDRAAVLAMDLRRAVRHLDAPRLQTLLDLLVFEIGKEIARHIERGTLIALH